MSTIPSIAMIPSGYKANKVYSVLPTDGAADLTFARTSTANRVNSNNLIEEVATGVPRLDYTDGTCPSLLLEPQSTNLITYPLSFGNSYWTKSGASIQGDASTAGVEKVVNGDFATDSDWTKQSSWTISGGSATYDFVSDSNYLRQTLLDGGFVLGKTYKIDFEITSGTAYININSNGGSLVSADTYGVGSHSVQAYASSNGNDILIYGRNTQGTAFSIDNVSVKEVQGFSAPSVDNPTSAFKLVEDTSSGEHRFYGTNRTVPLGVSATESFYIKANGRNALRLSYFGFNNFEPLFNFVTNTLISSTGGSTPIIKSVSIGNDWYRVSVSDTTNQVSLRGVISLMKDDNSFSYTGDGTSGVYIFGAQIEQQPYATSLMLPNTEGSTVTRVAETASKTGLASQINSKEGVLFWDGVKLDTGNSKLTISDGTSNNSLTLSFNNNGRLDINFLVGGSYQFILNHIGVVLSNTNKIAIKWKVNDFSVFLNGVSIFTDTSGTVPNSGVFHTLSFSDTNSLSDPFYSKTNDLRVYKTALSDTELATLTTI